MQKAFAYLRVSGKGQLKGDGFPRQLKAIKDYARQHDIRVVEVFEERGITGARETMDRPAWQAMITALHSNGVRTVIIEKLDRLSRTVLIQEATIAELAKHGFALVSVCEPDLMSDDPWRRAMRQMAGVFAELDKSQTVLKLRAARMRKKAATGRCEGRKPYGFRADEQPVLERMRQLRAEGMAYYSIADQLNAEGMASRSGAAWRSATVWHILKRQA